MAFCAQFYAHRKQVLLLTRSFQPQRCRTSVWPIDSAYFGTGSMFCFTCAMYWNKTAMKQFGRSWNKTIVSWLFHVSFHFCATGFIYNSSLLPHKPWKKDVGYVHVSRDDDVALHNCKYACKWLSPSTKRAKLTAGPWIFASAARYPLHKDVTLTVSLTNTKKNTHNAQTPQRPLHCRALLSIKCPIS